MRVSDLLMSNTYLSDIAKNKSKIDNLSKQIANQSSILKPSDSPIGTAKVLRLNSKIGSTDMYLKNIQNSFGFVDETIRGMESIESELSKILVNLTESSNSINKDFLSTYADQIDKALDSILTSANISYDGKYIFGGTAHSSKPYSITNDRSAVLLNAADVSGESKVKIGNSTNQKINISGAELFSTVLKQDGSLDSAAAIGSTVNDTATVYDSYGNPFDLNLTYTKTSATEYDVAYDIVDGGGTTVQSDNLSLTFDSYTGKILNADGKVNGQVSINDTSHKVNFMLDFNSLSIGSSPSSLSLSANQEKDIFNTIIKIRDDLKNGLQPDAADVEAVKTFHQKLLNKMSDAGYVYNNLENTKSLLETQRVEIESMISAEKDLDMAKAIMDMQNYDYLLQVSYKMSAMILPKSLLDFI